MKRMVFCLPFLILACATFAQDFRGASWGMSMAKVMSTEKGNAIEQGDRIVVFKDRIAGFDCLVAYEFSRKSGLVAGRIDFQRKNGWVDDFAEIQDLFATKYGQPYSGDTNPYSIRTRDGITITDIPDNVPDDSPELAKRVAAIRASRAGSDPVSVSFWGEAIVGDDNLIARWRSGESTTIVLSLTSKRFVEELAVRYYSLNWKEYGQEILSEEQRKF